MFLIPRDTPGFRFGKQFNKSGWRFYMNAELIFENARVPHANVVGDGQRRRPPRRAPATPPAATCSATSSLPPTRSACATAPASSR